MNFQALAAAYFRQHLTGKHSEAYYRRLFRQYFAGWTDHKNRFEIRAWHLAHKETPTHANKALGFLKAMYAWGQNTGDATGKKALWTEDNPARGVRRHSTNSRERILSDTELIRLFTFLEFCYPKLATFIIVLLCTGCRMSEARQMKWIHLSYDESIWYKPRTKNGTPHKIPLSRQALEAIAAMPRTGDYVFMGHYHRCWSRAGAEKAWGLFRKDIKLTDVTLHDFRRTVGSRIYEQTKDMVMVKAILNHRPNSITEIYMRTQYKKIAEALQANSDSMWALLKEGQRHGTTLVRNLSDGDAARVCERIASDPRVGTEFNA